MHASCMAILESWSVEDDSASWIWVLHAWLTANIYILITPRNPLCNQSPICMHWLNASIRFREWWSGSTEGLLFPIWSQYPQIQISRLGPSSKGSDSTEAGWKLRIWGIPTGVQSYSSLQQASWKGRTPGTGVQDSRLRFSPTHHPYNLQL